MTVLINYTATHRSFGSSGEQTFHKKVLLSGKTPSFIFYELYRTKKKALLSGIQNSMQRKTLTYILFYWTISFLHGCVGMKNSVDVVVTQPSFTNLGELEILNQNQFYPQLRNALVRVGFTVPPFASNSELTVEGQETDTKLVKSEDRIGVRHGGILSAFNPCIINKNAVNFKKYELEIIDLKNNETLMKISSGGWTENCPGDFLTMRHSTNLFGDLANGLARNYGKVKFSD